MSVDSKSQRIWQRSEVAERILAGDALVVYRDKVLRVPPSWLNVHPGGALAILHYVGRDATDEIVAYHAGAALARVNHFTVGRVEPSPQGWKPFTPPLALGWVRHHGGDGGYWKRVADVQNVSKTDPNGSISYTPHNFAPSEVLLVEKSSTGNSGPSLSSLDPPPSILSPEVQNRHALAFRDLHQKVEAAGLYKTPYLTGYGPEIIRYIALAAACVVSYQRHWFILSGLFLGLYWHQVTFTVHDLGHMGVTHDWAWDRLLAVGIANFMGGLSPAWWVDNHNIHHLVTNHPTHDPDIQHIPFFAISPVFLTSLYSSYYDRVMTFDAASKVLLAVQHRLYYVVMSLARFNLYAQSYIFLFKRGIIQGKRGWLWWLELVGIAFYWNWYIRAVAGCGGWKSQLGFLLISHMAASPVHVQIVLSHFARSTADMGPTESFVDRQLRTTADVICSPSVEFIHGGLHLQVTHHLFPRLPRHNLRAASLLVKEFAQEQGLEYAEFQFVDGNRQVLGVLQDVANQVRFMAKVADHEAKEKAGLLDEKVLAQ